MTTATKEKLEKDGKADRAKGDKPEAPVTHPPDPSKVKIGDMMAFVYYTKVQNTIPGGDRLSVVNLDNSQPFDVIGGDLVRAAFSADQFAEEQKVPKTKAAELLSTAFNVPFTVCFVKDSDKSERTLRGRLVAPEPLLGRSHVEDLDLPKNGRDGARLRLVDHRTIKWLILRGVKYVVGK